MTNPHLTSKGNIQTDVKIGRDVAPWRVTARRPVTINQWPSRSDHQEVTFKKWPSRSDLQEVIVNNKSSICKKWISRSDLQEVIIKKWSSRSVLQEVIFKKWPHKVKRVHKSLIIQKWSSMSDHHAIIINISPPRSDYNTMIIQSDLQWVILNEGAKTAVFAAAATP